MTPTHFHLAEGALVFRCGDRQLEILPEVRWTKDGGAASWNPLEGRVEETRGAGLRLECRGEAFDAVIEIAGEGAFAVVRARLIPRERRTVRLGEWVWRSRRTAGWLGGEPVVRRSLPYDVWGACTILPFDAPTPEDTAEYWRTAVHPVGGEREAMAWGVKLPAAWLQRFTFDGEAALTSRANVEIGPGEVWENDPFALHLKCDAEAGLAGPDSFRTTRRDARETPCHVAWNSWDYYHLEVDQEAVLENIEELRKHDWLRGWVRYVVIDDGWEDFVGKWDANPRFGKGMEWLAGEIRKAGFIPGLWAAPFFTEKGAPIMDAHPEYCVRHEGAPYSPFALTGCGPPWGNRCYLDPTRDEVVDHVYRMWRKFRGWGYRYFKTDFLVNPLKLPRGVEPDFFGKLSWHRPEMGLQRAHRRCMTAIRAAIGEESFWLGCGSIWATGAGLMDASRVSADIAVRWSSLVKCARNAFLNQFTHGRLWLNDPDFLVVRGPETAHRDRLDPPHDDDANNSRRKAEPVFTLDEVRVWAAVVVLSGGAVVLSDRIACLNGAGLEILKSIAPLVDGVPGRVESWEGDLPRVVLRRSDEGLLLGLFNWTGEERAPAADAKLLQLPVASWRDVWSGRTYSTSEALKELALPRHACALLVGAGM